MKIAITGHLGFVGTETTRLLQSHGHTVLGYDIMDGNDIRNGQKFDAFVAQNRPDRILHLAAIARFGEAEANPILTHETNVIGTMNIVGATKKYDVPLVFASTGSCYMPIKLKPPITEDFPIMGNSVYGCSKALSEMYVRKHVPHIALRYAHLYGNEKRYHGLIGGFIDRIEHDMEPVLYGGKQSNDFTYIKDVARANLLALTAPWDRWNQAYNIGTGEELTALEAGKLVCKYAKYRGKIKMMEGRTVDPERFVFDTKKAETMLGFKADYTFEKGLKHMFEERAANSSSESFNQMMGLSRKSSEANGKRKDNE